MEVMKIGFLGLGAMGSRMVARLVDGGHEVTVWNRSPISVPRGALPADTPRQAAEGAEVVLSMVTDDAASAAVWLDPDRGAHRPPGCGFWMRPWPDHGHKLRRAR
jgi:3-hydroxyisobutyrate dehydrogenase